MISTKMAGENATWYFARVWEDEESRVFFTSQDYEYERNAIMLVAVTVLVYAVGRFATYAVEVSCAVQQDVLRA